MSELLQDLDRFEKNHPHLFDEYPAIAQWHRKIAKYERMTKPMIWDGDVYIDE